MIVAITFAVWFVMAIAVLAISNTPLRIEDTVRATRAEGVARGSGMDDALLRFVGRRT